MLRSPEVRGEFYSAAPIRQGTVREDLTTYVGRCVRAGCGVSVSDVDLLVVVDALSGHTHRVHAGEDLADWPPRGHVL